MEIQNFSEYYESLQEAPEFPYEVLRYPAEVPEFFGDIQDNDLLDPDAPSNSETGIHKEQ